MELGLFRLEKRRLLNDLVGAHREKAAKLFSVVHNERRKGSGHNLQQEKFYLDTIIILKTPTTRAFKHWNMFVQRGCGIYLHRDFPHWSEQDSEQPDLILKSDLV